jgi:hypothetical protein
LYGSFFEFEGLIEDALLFADVLEAREHGRGGQRVELADGVAFAVGSVDETDEGSLFAVSLAGVFGVDTHAVGAEHSISQSTGGRLGYCCARVPSRQVSISRESRWALRSRRHWASMRRRMIPASTRLAGETARWCSETTVCQERGGSNAVAQAVREMPAGPSKPEIRIRLQTTASCCR